MPDNGVAPGGPGERVLLLTPTGRDAELIAATLAQAGFVSTICADVAELRAAIDAGGGAAVVAEEALASGAASDELDAALEAQPSWSDFPIIMLLGPGATLASSRSLLSHFASHGNVTLLERPVRTVALISTLQAALRARRRQYEVRDHLGERAEVQAALEQSEARYRSLTLATVSIVWIADPHGAIAGELPSWEAYTGQTRAEYQGWGWLQALHPEDREGTATAWRETLAEAQAFYAEYRLRRRDGQYRRVTARAVPVRGPEGRLVEWVGTCTDVEDERQVAEHLRQSQRIEAVGRLAGGMAHEVNNMMSAVIGFGQFALNQLTPGSSSHGDVSEMVKAATRAAGVTRQLLAFTRQQILQPSVLDLNEVITNLMPMLRGLFGTATDLSLRLHADAAHVRADRGQLEQVVVNLALNAQYAMRSGGRLTLETADVTLQGSDPAHSGVSIKPGPYVLLTVTDAGSGMDAETLSRVFEPFYTTKPVGEGTGLGLSVVYGIVKQSGGYIWLESEPGEGTSVKIYLPRVSDPKETPRSPGTAPRGSGEMILVVEDEDPVRRIIRRSLEGFGYLVIEAANGKEALQVVEGSARPPDLVLCDLIMPEMSGQELGDRLARVSRDIPILFMSASPGTEVIRRGLLPAGAPFIEKPFTADDLARLVRGVLERSTLQGASRIPLG